MEKLGKEAKDKITGFTGIITCKINYLYGCTQYGLTPMVDKDGKYPDTKWFDEGRLEIIGEGVNVKDVQTKNPGCENNEHPNNY